jgi:phosphatidylserine/phosphatidylglycerophosphate/cardiolipin synthase-like enzyme
MASTRLLEKVHRTVAEIPPAILEALTRTLEDSTESGHEQIKQAVLKQIPTQEFRVIISELLEIWRTETPPLQPQSLAFALAAAGHSHRKVREQTAIELVWTGPSSGVIPLRRTEQVLLEMIREAKRELLIVSFAVYDISAIVTEMERAITRGVEVTIVVETPESSHGKISFGADVIFTDLIKTKARILEWPFEQRERDESDKYGSLHAKCAVMDRESVLISSANLTQYALNLNMELGLLVKDKKLAEKIARHFETLKLIGVLC